MGTAATSTTRQPDWSAIERAFRTGTFTLRQLEQMHGRSASQICRRARKEGWTQDLREVVREATSSALIRDLTTQHATAAQQETTALVLGSAEVISNVILGHRRDVSEGQHLVASLMGELRVTTFQADALQRSLASAAESPDEGDRENLLAAVRHLTSLPTRSGVLSRLVDAMQKLQTLERRAFGIDDSDMREKSVATLSDIERTARILAIIERGRAQRAAALEAGSMSALPALSGPAAPGQAEPDSSGPVH